MLSKFLGKVNILAMGWCERKPHEESKIEMVHHLVSTESNSWLPI